MKRRALFGGSSLAFAIAILAGCTSQPTILPSRDLDRPADLTFVCLGAFTPGAPAATDGGADDAQAPATDDAGTSGELVVSGRPMRECHPRNSNDLPASVSRRTFAFMPQSSSGQLAVVDADTWKLLDLDPANAGFNQVPLGVLPSQIVSSDDGCRLVTANHGSCDLTLVDPSALMAPTLARQYAGVPASTGHAVTTQVIPHAKGTKPEAGGLRVLPGEIAFVPQPTAGMTGGQMLCGGDDWNWRAVVTFPSCDLIALVDLPSGEIVDGAYVRKTTTGYFLEALAGRAPVCAAPDCTQGADGGVATAGEGGADDGGSDAGEAGASEAGTDEAGTPDAGAVEAGGAAPMIIPAPVPLRPGPIAIVPETGRTYVGMGNGESVLTFDVTKDHLVGGDAIELHERPLGVSRLRLSIDPYLDKTAGGDLKPGAFIGTNQDRQYLYAVARDGSVRTVQVAQVAHERECESNIDPLNLPPGVTLQDACIPVETPPTHRRPTALGPGVRTPSPPIDVAVANINPTPQDQSESTVEGAHAWVLTASGNIYLINIEPVRRLTSYVEDDGTVLACTTPAPDQCHLEAPPEPNVLRNRNVASYLLTLDPTAGPARVDLNPSSTVVGPHIEPVWTRGTAQNATAQTSLYQQTPIFFPDPSAVNPQTWSVTWEGALIATPRLSGQVQGIGDTAALGDPVPQLYDPGSDFCRLGVLPGDLVTLSGCTNDTQCGLGKVCAHGNEGTQAAGGLPIGGLCLPASGRVDGGTSDDTCAALLGTIRRYEVTKARPNILLLAPHKDELVKPNLRPCTGGGAASGDGGVDGGADAEDAGSPDGGATDALGDGGGGADGGDAGTKSVGCGDPADPSTSGFQCVAGRCLDACTDPGKATGCRAGRICVAFDRSTGAPVEGDNTLADCTTSDCFCADGPYLRDTSNVNATTCIGELLGYQVNVGRGFLVSGGATGLPLTETAVTDKDSPKQSVCAPVVNGDPRNAMRISMDAPRCTDADSFDKTLDSRCNPDAPDSCPLSPAQRAMLPDPMDPSYPTRWRDVVSPIPQKLLAVDRNTIGPNACLFNGGPNAADPQTLSPSHVHALFRNQEVQFMMTNLETAPTGTYQIRFDVHGGFKPQFVLIPPTVEVTMPVRLFLGPVDSLIQSGENYVGEVPYLFVVDQRRLGRTQGGGPTRGQLLRIHPLGYQVPTPKGLQPWYEDFAHSGNNFPIQ